MPLKRSCLVGGELGNCDTVESPRGSTSPGRTYSTIVGAYPIV